MVLKKIQAALSGHDEKYEALYYKYSQTKLENTKLKGKHKDNLADQKHNIQRKVADHVVKVCENIEDAKISSFKVSAVTPELQRLLMDVNKTEKEIKNLMKELSMEEITASETFYDPELHEIASYSDAKGMKKGLIIKTVKKGFKFKNKIIKRPRVIVAK